MCPRRDLSRFLYVSLPASESAARPTEPCDCQISPPVQDAILSSSGAAICLRKKGGGARMNMASCGPKHMAAARLSECFQRRRVCSEARQLF